MSRPIIRTAAEVEAERAEIERIDRHRDQNGATWQELSALRQALDWLCDPKTLAPSLFVLIGAAAKGAAPERGH